MRFDELLTNRILNTQKALDYGFSLSNDKLFLRLPSKTPDFAIDFYLAESFLEALVMDLGSNERFLPIEVKNNYGLFVTSLKKEINILVHDVIENCFDSLSLKDELVKYIEDSYDAIFDHPWEDEPNYLTIKRSDNRKWFALFMDIPAAKLGVEAKGKIDVLNLKASYDKIESLVDNSFIFPAYHMNKKHWISVWIKKGINQNLVKKLIDESYRIVKK